MTRDGARATTWQGCYDEGWQGMIDPTAFAHPAKFAFGLITRIVRHGLDCGYWKPGDVIGDPFGGVALGGIVCGYHGLNWVGVELEPRFVELGNNNLAMHGPRWLAMEQANRVTLLQGDSRRFAEIVGEVAGCVTSPPFVDSLSDKPSAQVLSGSGGRMGASCKNVDGYGASPGQIGSLPSGSLDAVISSPPYAEAIQTGKSGIDWQKSVSPRAQDSRSARTQDNVAEGYGTSPGQIGSLPAGSIDGVVTSPPYSGTHVADGEAAKLAANGMARMIPDGARDGGTRYGGSNGQIGNLRGGWNQCSICGKEIGCPPIGARNSEDQIGQKQDPQQSSETAESAATADRQTTSTSTTKKTRKKPAASGTTHQTTSKRSAEPATQDATHSRESTGFSSADSVEPKSGAVDERSSSASVTNAAGDTSKTLSAPTASESSAVFLCADCAASRSQLGNGDTSTAQTSAASRRNRQGSRRTADPNAETYWSAMRQVYEQVHRVMKPGGVMACVVKDYISHGKRVPLCDQTCTLLESLGFTVFERTRAMLVKREEHPGLFDGEAVVKTVSRKSFFRRLCESKGSPPIDWEEVLWCKTASE